MANRFPLIFNSGAGQIQELAASDNLDLTSSNLVNAGILFTSSGSATAPSLQIGSGTTYKPGLYSPGTDQLAVATNGTGRLFVDATGQIGVGTASPSTTLAVAGGISGTAGINVSGSGWGVLPYVANSLVVDSVSGQTRLFATGTDASTHGNLLFFTGTTNGTASERLRITSTGALNFVGAGTAGSTQAVSFNGSAPVNSLVIDSSGRLGIGTSAPTSTLHIQHAAQTTGYWEGKGLLIHEDATANQGIAFYSRGSTEQYIASLVDDATSYLIIGARKSSSTNGVDALCIRGSGNVGIGTTGPLAKLDVISSTLPQVYFSSSETDGSTKYLSIASRQRNSAAEPEGVSVIAAECSAGDNGVYIGGYLGELNAATVIKMYTANNLTTRSGTERFSINSTGTTTLTSAAATAPFVANIGASEAARIDSSGRLLVGTTNEVDTEIGVRIKPFYNGGVYITNNTSDDDARVLMLNRQEGNGTLIEFRRGNNIEGTIVVTDTTVSYNGGHLARWSQLPNNENPSSILKGTVMSNLDEMCEWGNEDNEQLNKTKISDIESDKNVAGLFVSTTFDEIGPLDFLIGMTGDFIIRIAEGVTVERGDLLMSAGDGTAKPQDDDIIRSKTVAKVTSTNVSCTYEDGSYCVPCVLMAC